MEGSIKAREQLLLPVYRQVAVSFAQMHDSPVRMVAKGVVRGVVPWQQARPFLAHRLCRRWDTGRRLMRVLMRPCTCMCARFQGAATVPFVTDLIMGLPSRGSQCFCGYQILAKGSR